MFKSTIGAVIFILILTMLFYVLMGGLIVNCVSEIQEKGLKGIGEDIWYGENHEIQNR
jgi:hypothetical protein